MHFFTISEYQEFSETQAPWWWNKSSVNFTYILELIFKTDSIKWGYLINIIDLLCYQSKAIIY